MKKSFLAIATLALLATPVNVAAASPAPAFQEPSKQEPSKQEPSKEEAAAYKEWYDANAAKDYPKAMELAKAYVSKFPNGQNVAYLKDKWIPSTRSILFNAAVQQKNMADLIRVGKEVLADNPDNPDYLIAMSIQIRQNELQATPPNFAHAAEAAEFTEKAMKLIEGGKTPTPAKNGPAFDKNKTLAFLSQTVAMIEDHNKNTDKALGHYNKAAGLDAMNPLYFFHVGRLHQEKYLTAAKEYQKFSDADRDADPPKPEVKAALDEVTKEADGVINAWVRYMGLTADKPTTGDTRQKIESALTDLYKFRNKNSVDGLQKLIDQNKTSPTPVGFTPPAEPAKPPAEQKPAENAAGAKPPAKKP